MTGIPDPLPLRNIPVPREVTRVQGCDCGGLTFHRAGGQSDPGCSLLSLPYEEQMAAVHAAEDRLADYTAALNARLREALRP